jgi:carboxyl-terminal processing protease
MASHCRLVAGFILVALSPSAWAQQKLSRIQMEEDVKELLGIMRREYSYVDEKKRQHGVDLDAMEADAINRLDGVKSNAQFYDLLKELVARLRDGHCEVGASKFVAPKPRKWVWPVLLQSVEEGIVITGIHPSLAASGVGRGDLLTAVNDRPIEDWIKDQARTVSASSDGARRRLAMHRMLATADETMKMRVEHPDGTARVVTVKTCSGMRVPAVPNLPDLPAGKYIACRELSEDVGYIRIASLNWGIPKLSTTTAEINALFKSAWAEIDAAFAAIAKTKALVLDLRGNTGGWDYLGAHVACHLLPKDFRYYTFQKRHDLDIVHWVPQKTEYSFFKGKAYAGQVAVLIDEGSFSATDSLAAALADLQPAVRFVGRHTHGGTGGPTNLGPLSNSCVNVTLCTLRNWAPKGRLVEGRGTSPNVAIQWTREDVLKGRDADLDAAFKELRK